MLFNKQRLLGASVAAAMMIPAAALAQPSVSQNGSGSAVIVPYYTVNGGWATLVNLTNTTNNAIAVKFRMHEGQNSRDIMDFNVVLSPRDVWTASIVRDGDGRPRLTTEDRSCTSPLLVRDTGLSASEVAYTDFGSGTFRDFDGTRTSGSEAAIARMSEGYIAILAMGEDDRDSARATTDPGAPGNTTTAYFAKHIDGEPRNCATVDSHFAPTSNGGQPLTLAQLQSGIDIPGENGSGDPIARRGAIMGDVRGFGPLVSESPLKVTTTLVNIDEGTAANIPSLSIEGFGFNTGTMAGTNLVTAQEFPYFLEPTLGSSNNLWSIEALPALEQGIAAESIANLYTTVPGNGARAEWIVTLPTKRFRVDQDYNNIQAACNRYRNRDTGVGMSAPGVAVGTEGAAWAGFTSNAPRRFDTPTGVNDPCDIGNFAATDALGDVIKESFQEDNTGTAPITTFNNIYDREERVATITVTGGTRPSPAPPGDPVPLSLLDFETNIIRIGRDVANVDPVLNSFRTVLVDVTEQGLPGTANAGWMQLNFGRDADNRFSLPVAGLLVSTRNFGAPSLNFSIGVEHNYIRPAGM